MKVTLTGTLAVTLADILGECNTDMKAHTYHTSLIKMFLEFQKCLIKDYKRDVSLQKILTLLKENSESKMPAEISFVYVDELLYHTEENHDCLVILKDLSKLTLLLAPLLTPSLLLLQRQ